MRGRVCWRERNPLHELYQNLGRGGLNGLPDGRPAKPFAATRPVAGLSLLSGEWVSAKERRSPYRRALERVRGGMNRRGNAQHKRGFCRLQRVERPVATGGDEHNDGKAP